MDTLFGLNLNIHFDPVDETVVYGRKGRQGFQPFHVLFIGLNHELHANLCVAFRHVAGQPEKAAKVNITFELDSNSRYFSIPLG